MSARKRTIRKITSPGILSPGSGLGSKDTGSIQGEHSNNSHNSFRSLTNKRSQKLCCEAFCFAEAPAQGARPNDPSNCTSTINESTSEVQARGPVFTEQCFVQHPQGMDCDSWHNTAWRPP